MLVRSLVGKIPYRRAWQLTPEFLSAESHGQRSLVVYAYRDTKQSDKTEATEHTCMHSLSIMFIIFKYKLIYASFYNHVNISIKKKIVNICI